MLIINQFNPNFGVRGSGNGGALQNALKDVIFFSILSFRFYHREVWPHVPSLKKDRVSVKSIKFQYKWI
jgi:hypothetical protein